METKEKEPEAARRPAFREARYPDPTPSERARNDRAVGRRVGLYQLRGVIGSGSFSQVRFGIHDLTKGETNSAHFDIFNKTLIKQRSPRVASALLRPPPSSPPPSWS